MTQPTPQYKIGEVVRYWDEQRKGLKWFGQIKQIRINADSIEYVTTDHKVVPESKVEMRYIEMPF